jgi:hypothetical protein
MAVVKFAVWASHFVVWQIGTNISEEPAASIFRALLPEYRTYQYSTVS